MTRGVKFSTTTSDWAASRRKSSRPRSSTEVERDAALVQVGREEQVPLLPPLVGLWRDADIEPHRVGALDGLDLDDVCAEGGEVLGRRRTGPERGDVENPDTFERKAPVLTRTTFVATL